MQSNADTKYSVLKDKIYSIFSNIFRSKAVDVRNGSFIFPQSQPDNIRAEKKETNITPKVVFVKEEQLVRKTHCGRVRGTTSSASSFLGRQWPIFKFLFENKVYGVKRQKCK